MGEQGGQMGATTDGAGATPDGAGATTGSDNRDTGGAVGIACCNTMNAEHWLRERIGVLSSGAASERVTSVK